MKNANPAAATALPTDRETLYAYCEWLHMEKRLLCLELFPEMGTDAGKTTPCNTFADSFHIPHDGRSWRDMPKPSTRARLVLQAVGILPAPAEDAEAVEVKQ